MSNGSSEKPVGQNLSADRIHPSYSRQNPSPQYSILIDYYRQMHSEGYQQIRNGNLVMKKGDEAFPGKKHFSLLARYEIYLLNTLQKSCLDYGAGKSSHYSDSLQITDNGTGMKYRGLKAYWDLDKVVTWEPGLDQSAPEGIYDSVVCVDVLEHCYAADIPWIVDEIFSLAEKCVFLSIACYPAQAILPNGENVHVTVRTPDWWCGLLAVISARYPMIDYVACCTTGSALGKKQHVCIRRVDYTATVEDPPVLVTK